MNAFQQIGIGLFGDADEIARYRAERKAAARARKERGAARRPRIQVPKSGMMRAYELAKRTLELEFYKLEFEKRTEQLIDMVYNGQYDKVLFELETRKQTISHLTWRIHSAEDAFQKATARENWDPKMVPINLACMVMNYVINNVDSKDQYFREKMNIAHRVHNEKNAL